MLRGCPWKCSGDHTESGLKAGTQPTNPSLQCLGIHFTWSHVRLEVNNCLAQHHPAETENDSRTNDEDQWCLIVIWVTLCFMCRKSMSVGAGKRLPFTDVLLGFTKKSLLSKSHCWFFELFPILTLFLNRENVFLLGTFSSFIFLAVWVLYPCPISLTHTGQILTLSFQRATFSTNLRAGHACWAPVVPWGSVFSMLAFTWLKSSSLWPA